MKIKNLKMIIIFKIIQIYQQSKLNYIEINNKKLI